MKGAANGLKLGRHSCRLKASREIDVFIVEEIRGANADPCRRQAAQVVSASGAPYGRAGYYLKITIIG